MKWYWKVLIAFLCLLGLIYFSVDYFATRIIESQAELLKKQVEGEYEFNYKSLDLSLIDRSIVLREFEFFTIVDSTYRENKYDFTLDKLSLTYATYFDLFFKRSVDIIEVVLREPEIKYGLRNHKKEKTIHVAEEPKENKKIPFFNSITLEKFRIESGKVDFYELRNPDEKIIYVNDLDVDVNGFIIDLEKDSMYISQSNEKPVFSFKEITKSDLKKHDLNIDEIQYFFDSKDLKISNFVFKNKETPAVYRKSLSYRSPWFAIKVPEITINIDPRKIYDSGVFHIPKIQLDSVDVLIANDLNFPIKPGHKPMPGKSITSLKQDFLIDSLVVKNSKLVYTHKMEAADEGNLKFTNLDVIATGITDIDSLIKMNPFLDMSVSSTFWDEGRLNTTFRMDLSSSLHRIDVSGSLRNMAFKKAENMVKPLFGVEIVSGKINQMLFDFAMDENKGEGKMVFDYENLKIEVKKTDKSQKNESDEIVYTEKKGGFFSFAANEAVKTSNMVGDAKYKSEGNIIVDRIKFKPVFDLLWNCLANGMMDIAIKDLYFDSVKNYGKKQQKQTKKELREERKQQKELQRKAKKEQKNNSKNND